MCLTATQVIKEQNKFTPQQEQDYVKWSIWFTTQNELERVAKQHLHVYHEFVSKVLHWINGRFI